MKSFTLASPTSVDQALELLVAHKRRGVRGRVQVLAGGQDLLTEMKEHLAEPEVLVNLKGIAGLDGITIAPDGSLAIGALATLAALEEHAEVRARFPVLHEAARSIGSPQIRTFGTVGGNLCQRPRCWYYRNS
jgi:xanthine dehydrogenase YagS FAD-binding subunit